MAVVHKRVLLVVNDDRYADIARQAFARDNGEFVLDRVCEVKKARERLAMLWNCSQEMNTCVHFHLLLLLMETIQRLQSRP